MLSKSDREILIRIDDRTATLTETLGKLSARFDKHVEKDEEQFESLKKWRAYTNGVMAALFAVWGVFQWFWKARTGS
jgi:hypothetical protein